MKYIITKEDCQRKIDKSGNVCSQCGGALSAIETVDNADRPTHWAGCRNCDCYDYGVKPIIFQIAKNMVTLRNHVAYSYMKQPQAETHPEEYRYWVDCQIRGTSKMVSEVIDIYNSLIDSNK